MKKTIYIFSGIAAFTIAGVAVSQNSDRGNFVARLDTDGSGTVEKSEFVAMFDKRYAETDTNGDGISLDEYKAKMTADREERNARREEMRAQKKAEKEENREERAANRAERMAERTEKRFASMDADGNGTVSADEYKTAGNKMFDRMDRNDDGILNDRRRGRGEKGGRRGGDRM